MIIKRRNKEAYTGEFYRKWSRQDCVAGNPVGGELGERISVGRTGGKLRVFPVDVGLRINQTHRTSRFLAPSEFL